MIRRFNQVERRNMQESSRSAEVSQVAAASFGRNLRHLTDISLLDQLQTTPTLLLTQRPTLKRTQRIQQTTSGSPV